MRCIQRLTALPIAKPQMTGTDQITQQRNGSRFCPCSETFPCVGCAALSKLRPFSLATLSSTAAVVVASGVSASSWKCAKLRPLENMQRALMPRERRPKVRARVAPSQLDFLRFSEDTKTRGHPQPRGLALTERPHVLKKIGTYTIYFHSGLL